MKEIVLPQGTVSYRDTGEGPPILFLHGVLVNGLLWRKVVPLLESEFRCIVPDLPLGAHSTPAKPDADLSPPGLARLVADFMDALGLEGVTLVGNDTGGAIAQLVAADHPERLARVVLTNCDSHDNFFPALFKYLGVTARVPGGLMAVAQSLRFRPLLRTPIALGKLTKRPVPREVTDAWGGPLRSNREVRRDAAKALRGASKEHTLRAAEALRGFDKPVLLAWAPEDRAVFPMKYAERFRQELPNARLETVPDSYSFVPEDNPERLAELIAATRT